MKSLSRPSIPRPALSRKSIRAFAILATIAMLSPLAAALQDRPDYSLINDNDPAWDYTYDVDIAPSEVQRFLDLWTPRVLDATWFGDFVGTEGVPASILAEGFHGLDREVQKYLINKLIHHLVEDTITDSNGLPDAAHQQRQVNFRTQMLSLTAEQQQERLTLIRNMMFSMIFAKEELRGSLQAPLDLPVTPELPPVEEALMDIDGNATMPIVPPVEIPSNLTLPPEELLDPSAIYQEILANRTDLFNGTYVPDPLIIPDVPVPSVPSNITDPETIWGALETLEHALPPLDFGNATNITLPESPYAGELPSNVTLPDPGLGDPANITLPGDHTIGEIIVDPEVVLPPLEPSVPLPDGEGFSGGLLGGILPVFPFEPTQVPVGMPEALRPHWDVIRNTLDSTTYTACYEPVGGTRDCQDQLVGQSKTVGPITFTFSTTVDPVNYPAGFIFDAIVDAPNGAATKGKAWMMFEVPGTVYQIDVGFDGRIDGLADLSKIRGIEKDTTKAINRDIPLSAQLTFEGATPAKQHVIFALREMRVAESCATCWNGQNPIVGQLDLNPAPSTLTADMRFVWTSASSTYTFDVTSATRADASLYLTYLPTGSPARTDQAVVLDDMSTHYVVKFERTTAGVFNFEYTDTTSVTVPHVDYQHTHWPDRADANDQTHARVEVDGLPSNVRFSLENPFKLTYHASAAIPEVRFNYVNLVDGWRQPQFHGRLVGLPADLTLSMPASEKDVDVVYTAATGMTRVDFSMLFERRVSATRTDTTLLNVAVESIPTSVTLIMRDDGQVCLSANPTPIGVFRGNYTVNAASPELIDTDFVSLRMTGSGSTATLGAAWEIRNLTGVCFNQQTSGIFSGTLQTSGGRAFKAYVDTPSVKLKVDVPALPTSVQVDARADNFEYIGSSVISTLGIELTIGSFDANFRLTDVPTSVKLRWFTTPSTMVEYVGNSQLTRLKGTLRRGNVNVTADVGGIPTSVKLYYDAAAPRVDLQANGPITNASIQLKVNNGVLVASTSTAQYASVVKTGTDLGVDVKVNGVQRLLADHTGGVGSYALRMSPGGQPFIAQAKLEGTTEMAVHVNAMPAYLEATWNGAAGHLDYKSDAPLSTLVVTATYKHTSGKEAKAVVSNLPQTLSLDWATGATTSVGYSASGTLGSVTLAYKGPDGARFDAQVTSLPSWLSFSLTKDALLVDARTSATAAPGSGAIGSIVANYGSGGAFLSGLPVDDHAILKSSAGLTQAALSYTGLKQLTANVANDEVHLVLKNTAARKLVVGTDTDVSKLSAVVDKVPASVQVDFSGGLLKYVGSSTVDRVDYAFNNRDGLLVDLVLQSVPTTVDVSWDRNVPKASYVANGYLGLLAGKIRMNGAEIGTSTGDHVYVQVDGTNQYAADFRLSGWKKAVADFSAGGYYSLEATGGQPFEANAKLSGGDVKAALTVAQMPAAVTLDFQSASNSMTYLGSAANSARFTYEKVSTGRMVDVSLTGIPTSMSATWTVGFPAKVCYTASGTFTQASLFYRESANGKVISAVLDSIPAWVCAQVNADLVDVDARTGAGSAPGSAALGKVQLQYASNGNLLQNMPTDDHAILVQSGTTTQADVLYNGLKQLTVNTANDQVHGVFQSVSPRTLVLGFATPTERLTSVITQVPANVKLDYANNAFEYAASTSISQLKFNLDTLNGLVVDLTLQQIPTSVKVSWDKAAPKAFYEANGALGSLAGKVWIGGATVGTADTDHVFVIQSADSTALAIDFRLTGWKTATLDMTGGGKYALEIPTAGHPFVANALLKGGDVKLGLAVASMPTSMTVDFQSANNKVTYRGVSANDVRLMYEQVSTGRLLDVTLLGIPTSADVSWVAGPPASATYDANGRLTSASLVYRESTNGKVISAAASNLPPYMTASFGTDLATFDARTGAGAAQGSDSVGNFRILYGTNGQVLGGLPTDDHAILVQANGQTHAAAQYAGLKQVSFNTAADEVHATLKSASPVLFVYGFDTATSKISGYVDKIPTSVQIDYKSGSMTYSASSVVSALLFVFDDRADTKVDVLINSLPTSITLAWDRAANKYSMSTNTPIGAIRFKLRYKGVDAGTDTGQHVYVKQTSTGWGVDVLVGGISKVAVDPANGGYLEIGGTASASVFTGSLSLADGTAIVFQTSTIPSNLKIDLRHGTKTATYTGTYSGTAVALYQKGNQHLRAKAVNTPASATLTWTTGAAGTLTYTASGRLGGFEVFYQENTAATTFYGVVSDVPAWWQLSTSANSATFDARTGASAQPGTDQVGAIGVLYSSDGQFLSPIAANHVIVSSTAATRVSASYTGLKYLKGNAASDKYDFDVRTASSAPFYAQVETTGERLFAYVENVPTRVTGAYDGAKVSYTGTSAVSQVLFDFDKKSSVTQGQRSGEWVYVRAWGVPTSIEVTPDFTNSKLTWTSASALTRVQAAAQANINSRLWTASADVSGVPTTASLTWNAQHPVLSAPSAIGSIFFWVTNHDGLSVLPGNHANVKYDSSNGNFHASAAVAGLKKVDVDRTATGVTGTIETNGGGSFIVQVDYRDGAKKVYAYFVISPLPASTTFTVADDRYTFTNSATFSVYGEVFIGNAGAAVAAPRTIHGLSLRDGSGCVGSTCGNAIRGVLFMEGFPKTVDIDGSDRKATLNNWGTSASGYAWFELDVILTKYASPSLTLTALIAYRNGGSITAGPFSTSSTSDTKTVTGSLTSSGFGAVYVVLAQGTNAGYLYLSNVPSSVSVTANLGKTTSSATMSNGGAITEVVAAAKGSASDVNFNGILVLTDVPTTVSLSYSKVTSSPSSSERIDAPTVTYTASSTGLDFIIQVNAALFNNDVKVQLLAIGSNLGKRVTVSVSGLEVSFTSPEGATGGLWFYLSAEAKWVKSFDKCWPSSCSAALNLQVKGSAGIDPVTVKWLRLGFGQFTSATARLGFVNGFKGDYQTMEFGYQEFSVKFTVNVEVWIHHDFWITPRGSWKAGSFSISHTEQIYDRLQVAADGLGYWKGFNIPLVIATCWVDVNLRPMPYTYGYNAVSLGNPGSSWNNANIVTHNPYSSSTGPIIPTWIIDAIAAANHPYGNGDASLSSGCRLG